MRNATLHGILHEFTADSAMQFTAATACGAEIPFELIESDDGFSRVPLYCYRPLTGAFIRERLGLLSHLPSYTAASRALADLNGAGEYLRQRGEQQLPSADRERADAVLRCFLARVFEERSEFGLDEGRFEEAYDELERTLYDGRTVSTVIVPLVGIALDPATADLALGDGLSLVPGDAIAGAPSEAVWPGGAPPARGVPRTSEPNVLLRLESLHDNASRVGGIVSQARVRFRRVLTAIRLFERGSYALGPMIWMRVNSSPPAPWRAVPLGSGGRTVGSRLTLIPAAQEDELRAFGNLISRRTGRSDHLSGRGEVAWALTRFELGCERECPLEALTDYLLALRALLEPEGPSSGRLAQRLAVICAQPKHRTALAERIAHAIALERALIAGVGPAADAEASAEGLVDEVAEHLRALLRDVICGHLDADLCAFADGLLAEAAAGVYGEH